MKKGNEEKKTGNNEEPTNDEKADENKLQSKVRRRDRRRQQLKHRLREDIDTAEIEAEDWKEYMKRNTRLAEEKMRTASIPCWIMTHEKMKMEIGNEDRFAARDKMVKKKAATWNPGFNNRSEASRAVGRRHLLSRRNEGIWFEEQTHIDTGSKRQSKMDRNGKRIHTEQARKLLRFLRDEGITSE